MVDHDHIRTSMDINSILDEKDWHLMFEKIKRIYLYEKAKNVLPKEIFLKIHNHIELEQYLDFSEKIKKNLSQVVLYGKEIPKLHHFLNYDR